MAQWLRICLEMQGTWSDPLSWKIPHPEEQLSPGSTVTEAHTWSLCPQQEKPPRWEARALQSERAQAQQQRLRAARKERERFLPKTKKQTKMSMLATSVQNRNGGSIRQSRNKMRSKESRWETKK